MQRLSSSFKPERSPKENCLILNKGSELAACESYLFKKIQIQGGSELHPESFYKVIIVLN